MIRAVTRQPTLDSKTRVDRRPSLRRSAPRPLPRTFPALLRGCGSPIDSGCMTVTLAKLTASIGLSLCLGFAFLPLGCGGDPQPRRLHAARADPTLFEATVAGLTVCAAEGADRLTDTTYVIHFDVDANADGHVERASVKDSLIGDPGIESCMVHVLRGAALPGSIMRTRRVSPDSRRHMGNAAAAALGAVHRCKKECMDAENCWGVKLY